MNYLMVVDHYLSFYIENIQKERITILMPIYNGIEFIEESVKSIIKQTYTEWELIIGINGHLPRFRSIQKSEII